MNKEEILAMKAGRNLNLLITEKVMGLIAWEEKRGEYTHIVFQKPEDEEPYKRSRNWEKEMDRYKRIEYSDINNHIHVVQDIKSYSSDISAAFEIVEKMAKEGWMMYKLAHTLSGKSEVDGYICVFLNIQSGAGRDYTADTATLAICKAALLTLVEL